MTRVSARDSKGVHKDNRRTAKIRRGNMFIFLAIGFGGSRLEEWRTQRQNSC
jgi:hypothetical protein